MQCLQCQRDNRDDARFCDGCGAALARLCARCGHELRPEARFCDGCGLATEAPAPPATQAATTAGDPRSYTPRHLAERILTQKSALEGERKHVTVLFADLAGYTPLVENVDPEEIHALMDRCFQRILDRVHHYEGTVNQFTGDGVMALFGAPLALEDAPRRAVLAALGIQRVLEPLDSEVRDRFGTGFRMRIGIHSGPVVVGRIGDDLRMDYTAVGDTTNLAARLQQTALPGSVLISEATESQVSGFFDLRDLGAVGVKGKAEPVHAFEVLAERPVSGRIEAAADSGLTPLAGRERELDVLHGCFESAREERGQVVMLVGEAGIGKSRLLYEFRQRLESAPHRWFEGRCSSYGSSHAFQAIVDGVQRFVGIEDRDDEATALAKLARFVAELGDDLAWTLPYVRVLLSLPAGDEQVAAMDAGSRRSETFRALQAIFLRAAMHEPLVFAVEDLHWIDPASGEFLTFLADSIPTTRLLLLLTYRPGYEHPFGDHSYHVRLALQALSARAMSAMASSLLESSALPEDLLELMARKAEGNPLFVEEITKSLLEEGVLELSNGRVELRREIARITIPDRIQDVLMARLDRLPEDSRRAIQVASVIGREFALRLLSQIREAGDHVQVAIGELRSLELIYEKAAHPELAFMFKHALTHDVAYESILVARRKTLHRIVGSAIEELYQDRLAEHYEALAHHFERGEEWERAFLFHELAAQKSEDAYANHAVIDHCERALAIAERLGERADAERQLALGEQLGRAHFGVSGFRQSGDAYRRVAEASEDRDRRARNLGRASLSYVWAHEYEQCDEAAEAALKLARQHEVPAAAAMARTACDLSQATRIGPEAQDDLGGEGVRLAEASDDREALVYALSQRALFLEMGGAFQDARADAERALELAQGEHLNLMTVYPRWSLGLSLTGLGEYGRAFAVLQEALERCNRCGDRALKARLLNTLGWFHAEIGCHERAREYNEQGEALGAEMVALDLVAGAPELHANAAINLANNCTALDDPARALEHLEPVREALDQAGDPWMRWRYSLHVLDAQARVALARRDAEGALPLLDQEIAGARSQGTLKIEARALELRGRVLVAIDRRDEAMPMLVEALALAERIGYPPVQWRASSLLAELARRSGKRGEAERHAEAAQARVAAVVGSLPDGELRRGLEAMGPALAADPLAAYR